MAGDPLADPRRRVVGAKQTLKRLEAGALGLVVIARDADPKVVGPVARQAEALGIPVSEVDTMDELGRRCGIQVGAACAGLVRS